MSLYEQLPNDLLIAFFEEINKNIIKGILTDAMYSEIDLIKEVADKRNITLPLSEEASRINTTQ